MNKYKQLLGEWWENNRKNYLHGNPALDDFAQWLDEGEEMCFCLQHQTHHSKKDFIPTLGVTASAGESCSNSKFDKPQKPKKIEKLKLANERNDNHYIKLKVNEIIDYLHENIATNTQG